MKKKKSKQILIEGQLSITIIKKQTTNRQSLHGDISQCYWKSHPDSSLQTHRLEWCSSGTREGKHKLKQVFWSVNIDEGRALDFELAMRYNHRGDKKLKAELQLSFSICEQKLSGSVYSFHLLRNEHFLWSSSLAIWKQKLVRMLIPSPALRWICQSSLLNFLRLSNTSDFNFFSERNKKVSQRSALKTNRVDRKCKRNWEKQRNRSLKPRQR